MTPARHCGMLEGVTSKSVMDIAVRMGIKIWKTTLTGTAAELIPVVRIDNRVIGAGEPGPVFNKLLAEFREIVR